MFPYTAHFLNPNRRKTREVRVGSVIIGGDSPQVIQSMTTTPTQDTQATVDQIERLVGAGCQLVRITTPTMKDVEFTKPIREEMKRRKLSVPLVADVHFQPKIALAACDWYEKVRINPGNFADKKRFDVIEYSDQEYQDELDRIRATFLPILKRAKENGVALRIGTNHGSLSDRIMNRYGDTPQGMVESALEFIRIAEDEKFFNTVISMKASNPMVMIQAYRLLVARMNELGMDYPLHLGVTEAGDGEDGRVKSAVGMGSLLADGLGDTLRVSLTEEPEEEIPVARTLGDVYTLKTQKTSNESESFVPSWDAYSYQRRVSEPTLGDLPIGGSEKVKVTVPVRAFAALAVNKDCELERLSFELSDQTLTSETGKEFSGTPEGVSRLLRVKTELPSALQLSYRSFDELSVRINPAWNKYRSSFEKLLKNRTLWLRIENRKDVDRLEEFPDAFLRSPKIGFEIEGQNLIAMGRKLSSALSKRELQNPIHLHFKTPRNISEDEAQIRASTELGSLLCDGIGDSIEISGEHENVFYQRLAFNVLQATRLRMTKTDFIACPSCGRTLFDLQETTARIRSKTGHLKGLKIAIMGCIVNGPGEMADADFGYVGSGPGRINLYVGKECVQRNIPQEDADERLIDLIKAHEQWQEPAV